MNIQDRLHFFKKRTCHRDRLHFLERALVIEISILARVQMLTLEMTISFVEVAGSSSRWIPASGLPCPGNFINVRHCGGLSFYS